MTVYVLVVDDGNVCCPAEATLGVFSSMSTAEARRDQHLCQELAKPWPGVRDRRDYNIIEWTLDDPEAP